MGGGHNSLGIFPLKSRDQSEIHGYLGEISPRVYAKRLFVSKTPTK